MRYTSRVGLYGSGFLPERAGNTMLLQRLTTAAPAVITTPALRCETSAGVEAVPIIADPGAGPFNDCLRSVRVEITAGMRVVNASAGPLKAPFLTTLGVTYIPAFLEVELSGLAGDLAPFNDTHLLWLRPQSSADHEPRYWTDTNWPRVYADPGGNPNEWIIYAQTAALCSKSWNRVSPDPEGAYAEHGCDDGACADGDTCENSAGATCRARWAGFIWP